MKHILSILPILLIVISACSKENPVQTPVPGTKAMLEFKSEGGDSIVDLNIFAFNIATGKNIVHCFSTDNPTVEIPYGNYEIYALANAGKDLGGSLTLQELKKQRYSLPSSAVAMCGSETVCIDKTTTTIPITLVRCPARVEIDIQVSNLLPSMKIQSIQLKDAANSGLFFPTGEAAESVGNFPLEYTVESEKRALKRKYIVGENCRGTIPTIQSQREKNIQNAPKGATYLLINALCDNRFCTYRVFLGENNTSDFNLRRNSAHHLYVTIQGEDEIDARMESDPIEIEDDMEHPDFPGACIPGDYHLIFSPLRDNDETYTAEIEVLSGDPESFTVEEHKIPHTLQLGNMSSQRTIPVSYRPSAIDSESGALRYSVTIRSGKGNVYTKIFDRTFCNQLLVYISYPQLGYPEGGDVYASGRFLKRIADERYRAMRILYPGQKENLEAICDDGFALAGWYRGLNGLIITQNESYSHTAKSLSDTLAMKFKRDKCYIYTDMNSAEVTCFRKQPIVISEKSAYAVDPGDFCSIRGKDPSHPVAGWYDDPVLRTEQHLVSSEPVYDFTATENVRLYPKLR